MFEIVIPDRRHHQQRRDRNPDDDEIFVAGPLHARSRLRKHACHLVCGPPSKNPVAALG
jgi:hypothetical protein